MNAWQTKGSLDTRVANSSAMTRAMAEGAGAPWMISGEMYVGLPTTVCASSETESESTREMPKSASFATSAPPTSCPLRGEVGRLRPQRSTARASGGRGSASSSRASSRAAACAVSCSWAANGSTFPAVETVRTVPAGNRAPTAGAGFRLADFAALQVRLNPPAAA